MVFFDQFDLVHHEYSPRGLGIGGEEYLAIMQHLREAIRRKCPQIFRQNSWALLHDGAPAHRAQVVRDFFRDNQIKVMPHPGYSPDLNLPDYWLFALLKKCTNGERLADLTLLKNSLDHEMGQIPQADWATAMDRYIPRLRKCIQARGDYFEQK